MITGSNESTLCRRIPSVYSKHPLPVLRFMAFTSAFTFQTSPSIIKEHKMQETSSVLFDTTTLWTTQKFILAPIFYIHQNSSHIPIGSLIFKLMLFFSLIQGLTTKRILNRDLTLTTTLKKHRKSYILRMWKAKSNVASNITSSVASFRKVELI